ncbi:MAG: PCRF domain-containing protein, partial [Burkholderiales bacterium]|nr:PCRF domain-containing protein [Burkholderiales bacterium]
MNPTLREQFERLARRLTELDAILADPAVAADAKRWRTLAREQSEAAGIVGRYRRYQQREADLEAARGMESDPELAEMAREEITAAQADLERLQSELQQALVPRDPDDERAAFLEIRAGTGGDESALFAGD